MNGLINRKISDLLEKYLQIFPAVAILGPRQCGKSTLIKMYAEDKENFLYIDLQNRIDRQKIEDPLMFFQLNEQETICLDEVQLLPDIFSDLRAEIDRVRKPGRFVLLGSASRELIQHSSESLAGRIGLIDMTPFLLSEIEEQPNYNLSSYWFRGGYPDSYLAQNDESSAIWRENFIRTYLERDIPQLGFNIAAPKMLRLLTMLAYEHGGIINLAKLATSMNLSAPTIRHYIDIMEQTYIVRTLPPYFKNMRKRLVKTPRLYVRDTGLLHQVLNISDFNTLLSHPVYGHSWEGLVIENVSELMREASLSFFRSSDGKEEMDLLVELPDKLIAIECKASHAPQLTEGFWKAVEDLQPQYTYVVTPSNERYHLQENVEVIGIAELLKQLTRL
ncbi:MAG: ATP-binding protein [Bacteroidales bacterium]|nr:ATP-binding protein [Bacteroidales bacterium]